MKISRKKLNKLIQDLQIIEKRSKGKDLTDEEINAIFKLADDFYANDLSSDSIVIKFINRIDERAKDSLLNPNNEIHVSDADQRNAAFKIYNRASERANKAWGDFLSKAEEFMLIIFQRAQSVIAASAYESNSKKQLIFQDQLENQISRFDPFRDRDFLKVLETRVDAFNIYHKPSIQAKCPLFQDGTFQDVLILDFIENDLTWIFDQCTSRRIWRSIVSRDGNFLKELSDRIRIHADKFPKVQFDFNILFLVLDQLNQIGILKLSRNNITDYNEDEEWRLAFELVNLFAKDIEYLKDKRYFKDFKMFKRRMKARFVI